MHGIIIDNGKNTKPIFYVDPYLGKGVTASEIAEQLVEDFKAAQNIDLVEDDILNWDYVKDRITIGVQKESDEDIVKRESELDGIEEYLFVCCEDFSFKLSTKMIEIMEITEDLAWDTAYCNLKKNFRIRSMAESLGLPTPETDNMYIISNDINYKGAASFLYKEPLVELAEKCKVERLFLLPSSIHEMIVIPDVGEKDLGEYTAMVKAANAAVVSPEEALPDTAYVLDFSRQGCSHKKLTFFSAAFYAAFFC